MPTPATCTRGQKVNVSIPAMMTSIPGTVEAVHMVSRITPEGSKLFSADISWRTRGALTAEMVASATVTVGGETVYPYEAGKLEYYRTGDLVSHRGWPPSSPAVWWTISR